MRKSIKNLLTAVIWLCTELLLFAGVDLVIYIESLYFDFKGFDWINPIDWFMAIGILISLAFMFILIIKAYYTFDKAVS